MHFLGRYDFSKLYLLYMMKSGHLISWSVLKIFLSTPQPWIYFSYDIDTLKDVCDFFYDFMSSLIIFKKFIYACHLFLPIWTLQKFWGVFAAICPLNECSIFIMLIQIYRSCFLKFFVIKFHSKIFFQKFFCDAPFSNCMLMTLQFA